MITKKYKSWPRVLTFCFVSLFLMMACASSGSKPVSIVVPPSEDYIRVGVSPTAPPLIYKQGQDIVGLEAELAREFSKFLGRSLRFVELNWKDQIPALLDNRTDIIMSGMSITKGRDYRIAFSESYLRTGQRVLVRKADKSRFPGGYFGIFARVIILRIGVVRGTTGEIYVKNNFASAREILSFSTAKEAVDALKEREIDLFIYDGPMVYWFAAENEGDLAPLSALLTKEYLAWGIRNSDVELLESANKFVETLRNDGRLNGIIHRWIPLAKQDNLDEQH